jgi:hypothetical protein
LKLVEILKELDPGNVVENCVLLHADFAKVTLVYDILPLEADAGTVTVKEVDVAAVTVALTEPK